ncbi:MAG TPA: amidohydrolase family protein [Vicinamibacterales bacterium]
MFQPDLIVRSRRTVLPTAVRPAAIHIRHGRIIGVMQFDDVPEGCPIDDAADAVLMPGAVDTHVHVVGGFETTTRAAAAGGVTTIVVMPDGGSTTAAALDENRKDAGGKCFVDVGFWGGIAPGNVADLGALAADGVLGFKGDVAADIRSAIPVVAKLGLPLLVHAVLPGPTERAAAAARANRGWFARMIGAPPSSRKYAAYLAAHPKESENEAIAVAIDLCRAHRVRTHVLHLSSSDALTPLYHARASRLPISVETCSHYLTIVAEEIPDGATAFECDPPIRERENREYLWASLAGGLIQMVVSDHPHVSSLQLSLAATWTEAKARGYALTQLVEWMCRAPARLAGLGRKGAIDVGFDADLTIFNADNAADALVERTYLRGTCIYTRGTPAGTPVGQLLTSRSD